MKHRITSYDIITYLDFCFTYRPLDTAGLTRVSFMLFHMPRFYIFLNKRKLY